MDFLTDYYTSWVDYTLEDNDIVFHGENPEPDGPCSFEPDFYRVDRIKKFFPVPSEPYETYEE